MYILDSNFFIDANREHIPLKSEPLFWNWLLELAGEGIISSPERVFDELKDYKDDLAPWVRLHKSTLFNEEAAFSQITRVMVEGYGGLDEVDLEKLWADPWVIAHALDVGGTVVTSEKPGKQTAPRKKKIPSVCEVLHVPCCTITAFLWQMRASLPR